MLILLFLLNAAWSTSKTDCGDGLSSGGSVLLEQLVRAGRLKQSDVEHARVRAVEVDARAAIAWTLADDRVARTADLKGVTGALVTKPSGDVLLILNPDADAREVIRAEGQKVTVRADGVIFGMFDGLGWRPAQRDRRLPRETPEFGSPRAASLYGEPIVVWRNFDSRGRAFYRLTDYENKLIPHQDTIEVADGSVLDLYNGRECDQLCGDRLLREAVVALAPSATRDFMRQHWRALVLESREYPLDEMRLARAGTATINGELLPALIGPERLGRSWVIVIDPVTKFAVQPDEATKALVGPKLIPITEAVLDDGRVLVPGMLTWSVGREEGGAAAMPVSGPRPPQLSGGTAARVHAFEKAN